MTYEDSNRLPVNRKLLTRLFSKIKISTKHSHKGIPCWEWQAAKDKDGYGKSSYTYSANNRKHYRAHRLFYDLFVYIVPDHLIVDHLCRNPACCNPIHLDAITVAENAHRGIMGLITHCPQGHEYTLANCLPRASGKRDCRECSYIRRKNKRRQENMLPYNHPTLVKRRERERQYRRKKRLAFVLTQNV